MRLFFVVALHFHSVDHTIIIIIIITMMKPRNCTCFCSASVFNQRLARNHLASFCIFVIFWWLMLFFHFGVSVTCNEENMRKCNHSASRWTNERIRLLSYTILWLIIYQWMPLLFTIKWLFFVCLGHAFGHVERMRKCMQRHICQCNGICLMRQL